MLKKIKKADGLTLIELTISMVLMSIVVVIVFFIYLTASRAYIRWQSESSFTDSARLIVRSLNHAITNGIRILEADNTSVTILENDLRQSKYNVSSSGRLYKNDVPLSSGEYEIDSFSLEFAIGGNDSLEIKSYDELDSNYDFEISDEELSVVQGIAYSFTLSDKEKHKTFNGLIMMRNY